MIERKGKLEYEPIWTKYVTDDMSFGATSCPSHFLYLFSLLPSYYDVRHLVSKNIYLTYSEPYRRKISLILSL